jgi:hypothetical protein
MFDKDRMERHLQGPSYHCPIEPGHQMERAELLEYLCNIHQFVIDHPEISAHYLNKFLNSYRIPYSVFKKYYRSRKAK